MGTDTRYNNKLVIVLLIVIEQGRFDFFPRIVGNRRYPPRGQLIGGAITNLGDEYRLTVGDGMKNLLHGTLISVMAMAVVINITAFLLMTSLFVETIDMKGLGMAKMFINSKARF